MTIETIQERDLMGPHRGVQIKLIELHGVAGVCEWQIEREPFWMEITPELAASARSAYQNFCARTNR